MEIVWILGAIFSGFWVVEEITAKPQCYVQVAHEQQVLGAWRECSDKELNLINNSELPADLLDKYGIPREEED